MNPESSRVRTLARAPGSTILIDDMPEANCFNPVVIAPTFNNARTLAEVLRRTDELGLPVIVVDDGSTDGTAVILDAWQNTANHHLLTQSRNRGKAAALCMGFAFAVEAGFTHAVTIDTDGQLDPAESPKLLLVARQSPAALVIGTRDVQAPDYPKASRIGRFWANLSVFWESGAQVSDSQCGFRVYPLQVIGALRCAAGRYGYETEILTRAAWAGVPIVQTEVSCRYEVPEGRVTHYRPWRDSLLATQMHIRLLLRSVLPWPTRRIGPAKTGTLWHRLLQWISPMRAWNAVRNDPAERPRFATGLAVGVFIANLPLYGVQTVLSLFAARRLRLNPLATVAGSHFSTPTVGPVLIATAIALGHGMIHGQLPNLKHFDPTVVGYRALLRSVLLEWTLGGIVLGTVLAIITFLMTRLILRWVPLRTPANRENRPAAQAPALGHATAESAA